MGPTPVAPMTTSTSQANERLYFLDWLRILAFAALLVYHVGMYYVSWDFHVKSPLTHALWGDWFNHAIYLGMFILGAIFATPSTQWQRLASLRWPALARPSPSGRCWCLFIHRSPWNTR